MKFNCERSQFLNAINTASHASAAKSTIPALEGLLIEASDRIIITGFDLNTGIRTKVDADVREHGSIVLGARLICDIVRRLPEGTIEIAADGLNVKISGGMSVFDIVGGSADDYPELPSVDGKSSIFIQQKKLRSMLEETGFAISMENARPIHTGSLFETEGERLTVVSVDGYRLAIRREEIDRHEFDCGSFVVPGTALSEAVKIAEDSEELAGIAVGSKHICFTIGSTELISRRLEGEFLNYRQAIPQKANFVLKAQRRDLISAVERVSLIINERMKSPVRCVFGDGTVRMQTMTALGKAKDDCPIKGNGGELEIGFNNRYLLDALKAAPSDELEIRLTNGVSPCVMVPGDGGDSFLYLILPLRLRAGE